MAKQGWVLTRRDSHITRVTLTRGPSHAWRLYVIQVARSCLCFEELHLRRNASGGATGSATSGGRFSAIQKVPMVSPLLRAQPSGGGF